ncbi:MAG TPA: WD40 repeat domain-containing protein [Steroidobacteraceae bacterium]
MRSRDLSFAWGCVLLLAGCSHDRLRPETAQCAVDANQEKALWYMGNASNVRSGALVFTKLQDDKSMIEVWRGCNQTQRKTVALTVSNVGHLAVSESGRYAVASGSAAGVEVVDLESGKAIAHVPDGLGPGLFSPDERFVLFNTWGAGVRIFRVGIDEITPMANYKTLGSVYAMSADYPFKRLAIGDVEGKIQLLDIRETAAGLELINPRVIDEGNRARISGFGFSPTSDALYVLSGDGRLTVWDVKSGAKRHSWKTGLKWVGSVTFLRGTPRAVVFGTVEPSGLAGPLGIVIDTESGRTRSFVTRQNYLWGAYIPRSDELFVTGFWQKPYLEKDISVIP